MGYFLNKLAEEIEIKIPDHIPNSNALNYAMTGAGAAGVGYHALGAKLLRDADKMVRSSGGNSGLFTRAHILNGARGLAAGGLAAFGAKRLYDNYKNKSKNRDKD